VRVVFALRPQAIGSETRCLHTERFHKKENHMLWTIAVILIVLWLLGLVSSYTLGGFIHILLVLAVVVILINLIQGRRAL
jgi:hypothetical protein